jgi:peptidoglycan hydrolase-like amidase
MVQGGNPIKAWFSSTHGGIVLSSGEIGWNSTSWTKHGSDTREGVSGLSELKDSNKAYDKESPWFYCDWGARSEYNKTAWLKADEIADIINIILLVRKDSSTTENLYQVDKPNPAGKETWGFDRVKQELRSRGETPFNSINEISISADVGGGRTTGVTATGDAGSRSFDGNEFKNFFNLRAPANIQIVGPLYNVERK